MGAVTLHAFGREGGNKSIEDAWLSHGGNVSLALGTPHCSRKSCFRGGIIQTAGCGAGACSLPSAARGICLAHTLQPTTVNDMRQTCWPCRVEDCFGLKYFGDRGGTAGMLREGGALGEGHELAGGASV